MIHETIDEEVVIINLDKGHYYSLDGSGAWIWKALITGMPPGTIADTFDGDRDAIGATVGELVAELESEGLIVAADAEAAVGELEAPQAPFEPVKLQRYSDMEELLLLDPIHEVDEQGWPHPDPTA